MNQSQRFFLLLPKEGKIAQDEFAELVRSALAGYGDCECFMRGSFEPMIAGWLRDGLIAPDEEGVISLTDKGREAQSRIKEREGLLEVKVKMK